MGAPSTATTTPHTYSAEQIEKYLEHIGLKTCDNDSLRLLTDLVARQHSTVPFESLDLHYSETQQLSLDPEDLYRKVLDRRRGGYCMEMNAFFGTVLRSMGFTVTSVSGRIRLPTGGYTGLTHMVNLVTIEGIKYLVDVGYGPYAPTGPLALIEDAGPQPAFGPYKMRLEYRALEQHTDKDQRVWIYSHTMDPTRTSYTDKDGVQWLEAYVFTELELFPEDYRVLNLWCMTSPGSIFVRSIVVNRTLLDPVSGETVGMAQIVNDRLTVRGPKDLDEIVETKIADEDDRARLLAEYFNIHLTDAERQNIRGRSTELKSQAVNGNA